MKISGFQKMTLLDFPSKVACTVFTFGCNFRCPFCHNASLVLGGDEECYTEAEILSYLEKRKGILDGVCVTGGEPLLNPELKDFLAKIKRLGLAVKLDTNGSFPQRLRELCEAGLVDYIAMDIKNCMDKYADTVGLKSFDTAPIKESIAYIMSCGVDYEFRTTVVKELHTTENIELLAREIFGAKRYFLQGFVDSGNLIGESLSAHTKETLEEMKAAAEKHLACVSVRGI